MTKMTRFCMNTNYKKYQDERSNRIFIKKSRPKNKRNSYFIRGYEVTFYTVL